MEPPGLNHKAPQQLKNKKQKNLFMNIQSRDGTPVAKNHQEPDPCMLMSTEKLRVVKQDEYHPSLGLHLMAV